MNRAELQDKKKNAFRGNEKNWLSNILRHEIRNKNSAVLEECSRPSNEVNWNYGTFYLLLRNSANYTNYFIHVLQIAVPVRLRVQLFVLIFTVRDLTLSNKAKSPLWMVFKLLEFLHERLSYSRYVLLLVFS